MEITVNITDRRAAQVGEGVLVCGNSGDTVTLTFDAEWAAYLVKTVRFEWLDTRTGRKRHIDKQYLGQPVEIPVITDAYEVLIGAYAGNILSSTAARIPCERCVTDGAAYHGGTTPDIYAELLEALGHLPGGADSMNQPVRLRIHEQGTFGYYDHFEPTRSAPIAVMQQPEDEPDEEVR